MIDKYGEYITENPSAVIRRSAKDEYTVYHLASIDHPARRSFRRFEDFEAAELYALGVFEALNGTPERVSS